MALDSFQPDSLDDVRALRRQMELSGQRLVFTNGCFDLLHTGHLRYLQEARELGDAMVVAVNSDASVKALKGPDRPVHDESDRAELLAGLRCVDAVTIFGEERVTKLIEEIEPHVYAKGGDYTVDTLDPGERAALEKVGAEIRILPLIPGRSTTAVIDFLRQTGSASAPRPAEPEGIKVAVLGSGDGSNLQALIESIDRGDCNARITTVLSDQPESGFVRLARKADLATRLIDCGPNPLRTLPAAQDEILEHLRRATPDVIVLAGFMRILKGPVLDEFQDRIVNVHPSLLPRHKGRNAVQDALDEGELETGCTVHLVTEEIDAGAILEQATVPIEVGDDAEGLHRRIKEQEHRLLPQVLHEWRERGLATADSPVDKA